MNELSVSALMPVAMSAGQIQSAQTGMDMPGADVFSLLMGAYQSSAGSGTGLGADKASASLQQSALVSLPVLEQAMVAGSDLAVAQAAPADVAGFLSKHEASLQIGVQGQLLSADAMSQIQPAAQVNLLTVAGTPQFPASPVQTLSDAVPQEAAAVQTVLTGSVQEGQDAAVTAPLLVGSVQTDQSTQIRPFSGESVRSSDTDAASHAEGLDVSGVSTADARINPAMTAERALSVDQAVMPSTTTAAVMGSGTSDKTVGSSGNHIDPLQTQVQPVKEQMLTPASAQAVRDAASTRLQRHSDEGDSEGDVTAAPDIRGSLPYTDQLQGHQLAVAPASSGAQAEPLASAVRIMTASQVRMESVATARTEADLSASLTSLMDESSLGDERATVFASPVTASAAPVAGTISPHSAVSAERPMANVVGMATAVMAQAGNSSGQMDQGRGDERSRDRGGRSSDSFEGLLSSTLGEDPLLAPLTTASASPRFDSLMANVSMRQPQWAQDMGQKIGMMVNSKLNEVEIRLDPAELGSVQIRLRMDEDNKAHVSMTAVNGLTRDMLENALPRLREMLSQQGIDLGSADVNTGGQTQDERGRQGNGMAGRASESEQDAVIPVQESVRWQAASGLVDQFA